MLPSLSKHFVKALKATVKRRGPTQEELATALLNLSGDFRRDTADSLHVIGPKQVWDCKYSAELARALMT